MFVMEEAEEVKFAEIDCDKESELCESEALETLPQIYLYKDGDMDNIFDGDATLDDLANFIWEEVDPSRVEEDDGMEALLMMQSMMETGKEDEDQEEEEDEEDTEEEECDCSEPDCDCSEEDEEYDEKDDKEDRDDNEEEDDDDDEDVEEDEELTEEEIAHIEKKIHESKTREKGNLKGSLKEDDKSHDEL